MFRATRRTQVSLLDAAYHFGVDAIVVFRNLPHRQGWLWWLLKNGFQHVEVWKYVPPGAWLRFDTALEFISVEVYAEAPWMLIAPSEKPTFVPYSGLVPFGRIRQPWRCGPSTCVDLSAAFLGLRLPFWVRTPFQLYERILRDRDSR